MDCIPRRIIKFIISDTIVTILYFLYNIYHYGLSLTDESYQNIKKIDKFIGTFKNIIYKNNIVQTQQW